LHLNFVFSSNFIIFCELRKISEIRPITGADRIACAMIDGWKAIIKKEEFNLNDIVIYAEIDSWIPNKIWPHLTKEGKTPNVYNDIPGERLTSIKLRNQLSQGLCMPFELVKDQLIASGV
jgi:RNA ligase (TIGR02306 family)